MFDYMKTLPPVSDLLLKDLSLILTFLIFITSAQECQTGKGLFLNDMHFSNQNYIFHISTKMKQTHPNRHMPSSLFQIILP